MSKKVNSKQKQSGSKERIINVAVSLFARHGYAGTGMRELAANAAVNLAMVNYFFGSKKGLLKEILDSFFARYLLIAKEELTGEGTLEEKLEKFTRRSVLFFDASRDYLLVAINELPHDDPEIIEHKAAWAQQMIGLIDKEICQPLADEYGTIIPPTVLAPLLTSTMASRFLFAPVMETVFPEGCVAVSLEEYTKTISSSLTKMIS